MASQANTTETRWRATLTKLLSTKWRPYFTAIIINLESVNQGVKPGYLWDIGPKLTRTEMMNLVDDLKLSGLLCKDVYLICLVDDYFVVNIERLLQNNSINSKFEKSDSSKSQRKSNVTLDNHTKFVDVSKHVKEPKLIEKDVNNYQTVLKMVTQFLSAITEFYAGIEHSQDSTNPKNLSKPLECPKCLVMEVEDSWCIPTLFGILIGYPVVYWYEIPNDNLCCVPLTVYKVLLDTELCAKFELYSFSVPKDVDEMIRTYVEEWFNSLKRNVERNDWFKNVKLVNQYVVMKEIIL